MEFDSHGPFGHILPGRFGGGHLADRVLGNDGGDSGNSISHGDRYRDEGTVE